MSLGNWLPAINVIGPQVRRALIPLAIAAATGGASLAVHLLTSAGDYAAESTATVVVALSEKLGEPPAPVPAPVASSRQDAPIPGDRSSITRALQMELKRVGCYEGQVNGIWTASSRAAMKSFTGRVNAVLPVNEPDHILLALVQGQREKVCGATCPAGQVPGGWGRCQPDPGAANAMQTAAVPPAPPPSPALSDLNKALAVASADEEPDGPKRPVQSSVTAPAAEVQSPAVPPSPERRTRRAATRKQSFNPPPVASAVMKSLKNLQRALGGFP